MGWNRRYEYERDMIRWRRRKADAERQVAAATSRKAEDRAVDLLWRVEAQEPKEVEYGICNYVDPWWLYALKTVLIIVGAAILTMAATVGGLWVLVEAIF